MKKIALVSALFLILLIAFSAFWIVTHNSKTQDNVKQNDGYSIYRSRHGFSIEYPKDFFLYPYIEELAVLPSGNTSPAIFQILSYDMTSPEIGQNPEEFREGQFKVEVRIRRRDLSGGKSLLQEDIERGEIQTKNIKDFQTNAGNAKETIDIRGYCSIYLLAPKLEVQFTLFPGGTKHLNAMHQIVRSFGLEKQPLP